MSMLSRRGRGTDVSSWIEDWMRGLPMRRPFTMPWELFGEDIVRVDEYRDGNTMVVRAELPGIDPEKDVELTVSEGMLRIHAERRVEEETKDKGYIRHELSYGELSRTLPLPEGVREEDITATYRDGILEIRIPIEERPGVTEPKKIAISRG